MLHRLTALMSRAVPGVYVESAVLTSLWGERFFIYVEPNHSEYWFWFKRRYPQWKRVALRYKAVATTTACPEFRSYKILVNWLLDVLNLSCGERNLLLLDMGLSLCRI